MSKAASRANAPVRLEAKPHLNATQPRSAFQDAYRRLEDDIQDLARMLRVADYLQNCGEEDMEGSARLLVEKAAEMAEKLDQKYQENFTLADRLVAA
jgi:hypothetical protein